jgi:hypothetical protein
MSKEEKPEIDPELKEAAASAAEAVAENAKKSEYWAGLDKAFKDWEKIRGVHKPVTGKENQGVSEVGEKVREAQSLRSQGKEMHAQHAEQKAHIRHDDVIAQQHQMAKPAETPKATASEYGLTSEKKVPQIQSKWSKVKEQIK